MNFYRVCGHYKPHPLKVHKPLDVKTKFNFVDNNVLLELQLQNITQSPMFLELVKFDPASGFTATDLNTISGWVV